MDRAGIRRASLAFLLLLIAGTVVLVGTPSPGDAADDPNGVLHPELLAAARDPSAVPVEVIVTFVEQPAYQVARSVRPEFEQAIEQVRVPALAALARIEPLLPPREQRIAMGVGGVMEYEASLLTDEEVTAIDEANSETRILLAEMRQKILADAGVLTDAIQTPVAAYIEQLGGGRVGHRSVILNAFSATIPPQSLPELVRRFESVSLIEPIEMYEVGLNVSVGAIGASNWTNATYTGAGEKVAVLDTGIDTSHPAFTTASNVAVVTASTVKLASGSNQADFNDNASSSDDLHGHGTHVGGIVASNDTTNTGVAPGTSLLNAKCFYKNSSGRGSGVNGDILAATDWALTNGATVLSGSFGSASATTNGSSTLSRFFDAVVDVSGISVVIAAGNSGSSTGSINTPGDTFNIITVGAFNDGGSVAPGNDSLAGFSSRGLTSDGRIKPDLVGPGYNITSCRHNWEVTGVANFVAMHGTSMATPHVAGSVALLLDYTTTWQPEVVKALLINSVRNTSPVPTAPAGHWGFGALDLAPAYTDRTRTQSGSFTSTGSSTKFYRVSSGSIGDRATLCWNRSVPYNQFGRLYGAGNSKTLVNLNLYLYDESDGDLDVGSTSSVDSVEQVKAVAALTSGILKVKRSGTFPTGQTSVSWGLASANTPVAVDAPDLACTYTAPTADPSGNFTVTVRVDNDGDIKAPAPTVTLTLPTGFSFVSPSTAATTLADIAGDGSVTTSWTVSPGTQSSGTLSVQATVTDYGETFTGTAATKVITVATTGANANAGADINLGATSASGRSVSLDGTGSTGTGLAYAWDTDNDGSYTDSPGSATGSAPSVAFAIGTHTVTLRVTDDDDETDTDTVSVVIDDNDPVADAGPNKTANEGSSVSFSGTGSTDVEGTVTYAWNFGDGSTSTSATPTHTFVDNGTFTVTLTVTDSASQTDTDTATATIANVAPTANAGTDKSAAEGTLIAFAGTATDPGSDTLTYSWSFGDGETGTGANVTHAYDDEGTYTATLTVSDGDGGTDTDTAVATVTNVAPTANAGSNRNGGEGSSISFTGSATDPGDDTLTYAWNFGDGTTGTGAAANHVYTDQGVYTATLSVSDGDGGTDTDTASVTITNVAPTASAGADKTGNEGTSLSFAGSATDPGNDTLTYAWTFGDGGTASTASATHTYADEGTYTAILTVSDGDGGVDTDTLSVTVANVAPSVNAGPNKTGNEGSSISFSGSATDPGTADSLTYSWNFGDGQSASGASVNHTYADNGAYTATLSVSDGDGGTGTDTVTVNVSNVAPTANAGSNRSGNEGASISFTGSATDPGADTLTYSWNFGDGTTGSGSAPNHAYADNGSYTVTLTVSDGDGGTDTDTMTVTIANVAPVANAGADISSGEGSASTFAGSATDAGSADTFTYAWNFGDGSNGTGASPSHAYADEGTYTATLTVTDDDGAGDTDTVTVTVVNIAPTANAGPNKSSNEGASVSFAGTATDPGGDTLTYSWTFGDGTSASGANATHTYADNGTFTATLSVSDGDGGVGTDTAIVTVANLDPTANAGANQSGNEGTALSFSGSATDPGADTFSYSWNFGDGETATGATPSHAFGDEGSYTVTLTVTDDDGGTDTDTLSVSVANVAPTANAGANLQAGEGTAAVFAGSATDPGDDTLTYAWNFGDGTTGSGAAPSHAYPDEGTYTATLTVTDGDGGSDTDTLTVTVVNVAPTANAGSNRTGNEGASISFTGSATDPGNDTLTYAWNFGDGSTGTGSAPNHAYADDGTYTATLSVSDGDGGVGTDTATVTIRNVAPTAAAGSDVTGDEGDTFTFTGTGTDVPADPLTYAWNFGDGTTATGASVTHTFTDDDAFTVTLTVSDGDGGVTTDTLIADLANVAPVAEAGSARSGTEGSGITFGASATDVGSSDTLTFAWNFGDSSTGTGAAASHAYADDGTYTATLTVTDDDGGSSTDTVSVTVSNAAPVADAGAARSGDEGSSVSFVGTATDAGVNDVLSYSWNFGDGSTASTATASHAYVDDGTYTATLTVTDGDGGSDTSTSAVTVRNVAPVVTPTATAVSGGEGSTLVLSASATDVGTADTLSFAWDHGDGTSGTGTSVSHVYADDGVYNARVTVTDGDGGSTTATVTVTVLNIAPTANAGSAPSGNEGSALAFAGSATDPGADTLTYTWSFGDGTTGTGAAATHAYGDEGTYTTTLTVSDGDGGVDTDTLSVTVTNVAPTADAGGTLSGGEGSGITFAGSATDPGTDDVLSYAWNFGDGSSGTGATPSHSYADDGTYTATLTVTDGDGGSDTDVVTVTVANVAPTGDAGAPLAIDEGGEATLTGTATDPGAGDVITYAWNFGDGATASGASVTHTYTDDGVYTATLTVSDDDGGVATATTTVAVANVAPTITLLPNALSAGEGSLLLFVAAATDPGDDELTFTWDFGDGSSTATGSSISRAYGDDGSFSAVLTVTDGDGGSTSDVVPVTVLNLPPVAAAGDSFPAAEGAALTFAGSATDPGFSDTLTYVWDFGDGSTGEGARPTHAYANEGTYTATLTVTDGAGATDSDTLSVTVSNVAPEAVAGDDIDSEEGMEITFAGSGTDPGVNDSLTFAWDFGDGATSVDPLASHVYTQDGDFTATLTVTDDAGAASTSTLLVSVANVAPSLVLPMDVRRLVGEELVLALEPTDPSDEDQGALDIAWRILESGEGDATGSVLVEGAGPTVSWMVDRSFTGLLEVTVRDDDDEVVRTTSVHGATAPFGDALAPALALGLDARLENQVLSGLLDAQLFVLEDSGNGKRIKKAAKRVKRVLRLLEKAGVTDGATLARLQALLADLEAGVLPPVDGFRGAPGTTDLTDLIAALPGSSFRGKARKRLAKALLGLHLKLRKGAGENALAKARRKAQKAASKLEAGAEAQWFVDSVGAL